MQEFFWFFLGGLFYLIIGNLVSFYKKIQFINDIKIHSFKLIGFAYEHLIFAMAAKYLALETDLEYDEEKIKLFKNNDEAAFEEWKKDTVRGLNKALPPYYEKALEVENWDDLMDTLDKYYKKSLREARQAKAQIDA